MEVPIPEVGPGEVRVHVKAAGSHAHRLRGALGLEPARLHHHLPAHHRRRLPAGVVDAVGEGVTGFAPGDEVLGYRTQLTYAEYVVAPPTRSWPSPPRSPGRSPAASPPPGRPRTPRSRSSASPQARPCSSTAPPGGVGTIAVQLAVLRGAKVIATAREENHAYLRELGAIPVTYGDGLIDRVREAAPEGIDAASDTASADGLRVAAELVKDKDRVGTIFAYEVYEELGVRWIGSQRSTQRLGELAALVADGKVKIHVRKTFPLAQAGGRTPRAGDRPRPRQDRSAGRLSRHGGLGGPGERAVPPHIPGSWELLVDLRGVGTPGTRPRPEPESLGSGGAPSKTSAWHAEVRVPNAAPSPTEIRQKPPAGHPHPVPVCSS
ncbi:zinc-binding dehydrogenase [Streptomyces thinghirensis]|nr:zinc-binding dehydrogenase [Streptomyces thinghirensis]